MKYFFTFVSKRNFFTLIVIFLALSLFDYLNAEIKYKKIDTTISAPLLNQSQMYYLDMNDDGTAEYFFNHGNQMGNLVCEIYSSPPSYTNEILVENNIPSMLDFGESIYENSVEWLNTYNGMSTIALYFQGNWPGATDKYVAIRFKINNAYHYGWIGMEIPSDSTYIRIKDCAYEDNPNGLISAGVKETGINDEESNYYKFVYTGNKLFINSPTNNNNIVIVYNINGNLLLSDKVNKLEQYIDFENFKNGIYIVILKNDNKIIDCTVIIR
ncbi:MAG: T9SS type A sorting domain-containing protein [Bacteroidetes bacterium]|nr:MAG: T9SS type A sorting domain-containing protein [Bacteroidota bacterium]